MAENRSKRPSPRQAEILELVAEGLGDKEIAARLDISVHTVRTHLGRIFRDQDVPNRAAAASAWIHARAEDRPAPEAAPATRGGLFGRWPAMIAAAALILAGVLASRALALSERPMAKASPTTPAPAGVAAPKPPPSAPAPTAAASPGRSVARPAPPVASPRAASPTPMTAARAELEAVNGARAAAGLAPLAWNDCLAAEAGQAAQSMATLGAVPPSLTAPSGQCGALLAGGSAFARLATADDTAATAAMLADPARRAQLLAASYRQLGAAWAVGAAGAYLAVELE